MTFRVMSERPRPRSVHVRRCCVWNGAELTPLADEQAHNGFVLQRPGIRTDLPLYLLTVTPQDLAKQAVRWNATAKWSSWLAGYPAVFQALRDEVHDHGGCIRREFVHSYASRDPVELFYVTMAWGLGTTNVRWRGHQEILSAPPSKSITGIVHEVQTAGAGAGWHALYGNYSISGLGYAFGTKVLYFAGYHSGCPGPRPLILDGNVLSALHDAGTGFLASGRVRYADYLGYLNLVRAWADDSAWPEGTPELAEYALFERGRELNDLAARRRAGS